MSEPLHEAPLIRCTVISLTLGHSIYEKASGSLSTTLQNGSAGFAYFRKIFLYLLKTDCKNFCGMQRSSWPDLKSSLRFGYCPPDTNASIHKFWYWQNRTLDHVDKVAGSGGLRMVTTGRYTLCLKGHPLLQFPSRTQVWKSCFLSFFFHKNSELLMFRGTTKTFATG